jgi:hypothetical protein
MGVAWEQHGTCGLAFTWYILREPSLQVPFIEFPQTEIIRFQSPPFVSTITLRAMWRKQRNVLYWAHSMSLASKIKWINMAASCTPKLMPRNIWWPLSFLLTFTNNILSFYLEIDQYRATSNPGRDSSVGTATRYGLDGPGFEFRWGPGAHPASYTMGTESHSREYIGRGAALTSYLHLPPRLKKEWSYTSPPPLDLRGVL